MKANRKFGMWLAIAVGIATAVGVGGRRKSIRPIALPPSHEAQAPTPLAAEKPDRELPAAERGRAIEASTTDTKPPAAVEPKTRPELNPPEGQSQPVRTAKAKEPIQDPAARAVLSFVGLDPVAEEYWVGAINDPNLPSNERKDLIEDLNEDGLSDPKHPVAGDFPLIASRIQLIEELAPFAMDQVNADAFAEAYKDLLNMLAGQPVK